MTADLLTDGHCSPCIQKIARLKELMKTNHCVWDMTDEDDGNTTTQLLVWLHPAACWWSAVLVLLAVVDISMCQSTAVTQYHHLPARVSVCLDSQSAHQKHLAQMAVAGGTCCPVQTVDVLFRPSIYSHTAILLIQCLCTEIHLEKTKSLMNYCNKNH